MDPAGTLELIAQNGQKAMNEVIGRGDSDIQRFYSDATVFVTGGSGFLGKLLIEKLLRSCNIKKIFILMRDKKEKTREQRLDAMLADPVYDILRQKQPQFSEKLVLVGGNIAEIRLGISDQDWKTITEEVNVIFHMAATTRFDESLRVATLTNLRGTREVLHLAKDCNKLSVLVHVSTAYSHATTDIGSEVKEQFYPSPLPPDAMIQMAENMDSTRLDAITPSLINGWPNTYTFTKAVSEELVRTMSGDLPVCIIRPPIVICTACEPTPGWMDQSCVYSASGVVLGVVLGLVHLFPAKKSTKPCFMPADYVNNVTIAAGWDAVMSRNRGDRDIKIYCISNTNSESKMGIPCHLLNTTQFRKHSSPKAIWYCYLLEVDNKTIHWILFWLLHYIPAYIADGLMFLLRVQKPQGLSSFVKLYTKIQNLSSKLAYFGLNHWSFRDDNVQDLFNKMSDEDKAIYNFQVAKIDWTQLMYVWCMGTRKYLVRDGLKDSEYGYKKQKIFRILNYTYVSIYFYVFYVILHYSWKKCAKSLLPFFSYLTVGSRKGLCMSLHFIQNLIRTMIL